MITIDATLVLATLMAGTAIAAAVWEDRRDKRWERHVNRALRIANNETGPRGRR